MGVNIKTAGGIAIGGLLGFYLINKALNFAYRSINEITEASKWRAYYRHGCDGKMVPPGYSRVDVPGMEGKEYVHPSVLAEREKEEKRQAKEQIKTPIDTKPIADSIEKLAKAFLKVKGIDIDEKPQQDAYCTYSEEYNREFNCDPSEVYKEDKNDIPEAVDTVFAGEVVEVPGPETASKEETTEE